jgi:hypothetical protein
MCEVCVPGAGNACPAATPACAAPGVCVECTAGDTRACGAMQVCDDATDACVECNIGADCAGHAGGSFCVAHACVACASDADCPLATAAACNHGTHVCEACGGDGDCAHLGATPACAGGTCKPCNASVSACSGATPACDASANACVECTASDASACSAATPVCELVAHACVECTADADCGATAPRCDLSAHICVACLAPADCTDPAAARCTAAHMCAGCTMDAQCARLASTPVCDEPSAACVECTRDADCPGASCDLSAHTCTSTPRNSLGFCERCVSDIDCILGSSQGDFRCVPMDFAGSPHGSFCQLDLSTHTGLCPNRMPQGVAATSLGGVASTYCEPKTALTTCEAVLGFQSSCTTNAECGATALDDATCRPTAGGSACTYTCLGPRDCGSGVPCNGAPTTCQP